MQLIQSKGMVLLIILGTGIWLCIPVAMFKCSYVKDWVDFIKVKVNDVLLTLAQNLLITGVHSTQYKVEQGSVLGGKRWNFPAVLWFRIKEPLYQQREDVVSVSCTTVSCRELYEIQVKPLVDQLMVNCRVWQFSECHGITLSFLTLLSVLYSWNPAMCVLF